MLKVVEVNLIKLVSTLDELNNPINEEVPRTIMGRLLSVKGVEFYQAQSVGLKPELVVEIWQHEYQGEHELAIDGKRYHILRTFARPGSARLELVCYKDLPKEV